MDVITKDVRALAKKELAAANRRFRMFASPQWSRNTNAASGTTGRAAGCRTMERGLNL